jgi:hypothetical protein
MNELLALIQVRFQQTKAAITNASWESFVHSITHMGPVEMIGWVVTILFMTYHGIKNQRMRLIVAKICAVITIFYFFLRGDLPMFAKWLGVMGINIWMWKTLGKYNEKELVDE